MLILVLFVNSLCNQPVISSKERIEALDKLENALKNDDNEFVDQILKEFNEIDKKIKKNKPFVIKSIKQPPTNKEQVKEVGLDHPFFVSTKSISFIINFYKEEDINGIKLDDNQNKYTITIAPSEKGPYLSVDSQGNLEEPLIANSIVVKIESNDSNCFYIGSFDFF